MAGVVPFNNKAVPESFIGPSEVFAGSNSLQREEDGDSDDDPFASSSRYTLPTNNCRRESNER